MGALTTHVLNTMSGQPAADMKIDLWIEDDSTWRHLKSVTTNQDGRVSEPLLDGEALRQGSYELRFHAADYLRTNGVELPEPPFLDVIPIRFGISNPDTHYHVPLLLSAFGYSTYRGS